MNAINKGIKSFMPKVLQCGKPTRTISDNKLGEAIITKVPSRANTETGISLIGI